PRQSLPSPLYTTSAPPPSTLFPYTTLFRSAHPDPPPPARGRAAPDDGGRPDRGRRRHQPDALRGRAALRRHAPGTRGRGPRRRRSEEHTSELQSLTNLVCRLLLAKKKTTHP